MGKTTLPTGLSRDLSKPAPASGTCSRCGYDLRGLTVGACCPECGMVASARIGSGTLGQAPDTYLKPLERSAWCLAIGFPALWLMTFGVLILALVNGVNQVWPIALLIVPSGIMAFGAWGVTRDRVFRTQASRIDSHREWRGLRLGVRGGAALLILAIVITIFAAQRYITTQELVGVWIAVLAWFAGFVGLLLIHYDVALLSTWGEDDALADRLRLAPLILLVALVPMLVAIVYTANTGMKMASYMMVRIGWAIVLAAWSFSTWQFLQFANLVSWARRNLETTAQSEATRNERILARIRTGQSPLEPGEAPPVPNPPPRPQGNVLAESGGGDTYDVIEPEK